VYKSIASGYNGYLNSNSSSKEHGLMTAMFLRCPNMPAILGLKDDAIYHRDVEVPVYDRTGRLVGVWDGIVWTDTPNSCVEDVYAFEFKTYIKSLDEAIHRDDLVIL
jgi:hypothetical protein